MTRRRTLAAGVLVAGFAGAVLVPAAISALDARADLTAARGEVDEARRALADSDAAAAAAAFDRAANRFRAGGDRLMALPVRVVAWVPGVRANVVVIRQLAAAGAQVADAGGTVTGDVAALHGGLAAFAPRDGVIPLEPIEALARPLAHAADELTAAAEVVDTAPQSWLAAPVADARAELAAQLTEASQMVRTAAALADQLPTFLGADGQRRYFLGAQNPAELRGTGGLIGAYGVLTVEGGRIDISTFEAIGTLTLAAPDDLPPPNLDFEARYARFSAGVHGSNINMTPDVPTAATAIETLYEAAKGEPLDGTILADPLFFKALLEVVGPTDVPAVGTIAAEEVVSFVTRDQYAALGAEPNRKELLGEVAGAVLRRFLTGDADPGAAVAALGGAVGDGRLRLHATDPDVQAAFAVAGVDGALSDPAGGDYLAVVGNNAAANKLDTFLRQEITYDARLRPDGSVQGRLVITLTNTAPTAGFPPYVLGPHNESLVAGENRTYWSVYCAPGCLLEEFKRDGESAAVTPEREGDRPVFSTTVTLASGESETLEYRWTVPDVWSLDTGYQLTVDGQPTLMDGATTVRVLPGEGVGAISGAPPITASKDMATWVGTPSDRMTLHADVQPPRRTFIRRVADLLSRPLLAWAADSSTLGQRVGHGLLGFKQQPGQGGLTVVDAAPRGEAQQVHAGRAGGQSVGAHLGVAHLLAGPPWRPRWRGRPRGSPPDRWPGGSDLRRCGEGSAPTTSSCVEDARLDCPQSVYELYINGND